MIVTKHLSKLRIPIKSDYVLLSYIDDEVSPLLAGMALVTWQEYWDFIHQLIEYFESDPAKYFYVNDMTLTYERKIQSFVEFLTLIRVSSLSSTEADLVSRAIPVEFSMNVDILDWFHWLNPDSERCDTWYNPLNSSNHECESNSVYNLQF